MDWRLVITENGDCGCPKAKVCLTSGEVSNMPPITMSKRAQSPSPNEADEAPPLAIDSIHEVISIAEKVTGKRIQTQHQPVHS